MSTLHELQWEIQQLLHQLIDDARRDLLHQLAVSCQDEVGEEAPEEDSTAEELFDFIVDFLRSKQLRRLEDQGMSRLLVFRDLIDELQVPQKAGGHHHSAGEEEVASGSETDQVVAASLMSKTVSTPVVADQVTGLVKLTEVAALLPRREFRIHGGQISDSDSDVSYNSLSKQIDEGLSEGFTEAEVIRTVLRIIKPGTFKEMLITKDSLTVAELKRFLRAHLKDKSSTELFQELSNARQHDKESPQQFMYRLMGLKQRVLFASKVSTGFQYDKKLVQGVFLHSLYQGIHEKYSYIRRDLKPYISDENVTDDFILDVITRAVSEDTERQNRLGHTLKSKTVSVSTVQMDKKGQNTVQMQAEVQANRTAIQELTAQVSSLTKSLEKALTPMVSTVTDNTHTTLPHQKQTSRSEVKRRCQQCASQGNNSCIHCFKCGKEGHRAIGCLIKTNPSGNWVRSLGRDHQ